MIARPALAAPTPDDHKYSRGLVVVVQGEMRGAALLAARAAMRGGAGYVILAGLTPEGGGPDALVRYPLERKRDLAALLADERIGAVVVGPGLGRSRRARGWLDLALDSDHPLVIDGDALTLLGRDAAGRLRVRGARSILTPHAGEFDRMFADTGDKPARTVAAATRSGATIVHKGGHTVIATPDGAIVEQDGASPWLATAGTGDVLAGLIAARLAAKSADPAGEGVWLHNRVADLAGPAFIADDLIALVPVAIAECL